MELGISGCAVHNSEQVLDFSVSLIPFDSIMKILTLL